MTTKVKGEAIKDNSIPLSALSENIKNIIGSYHVIATFNTAGIQHYNGGIAEYYYSKVGNVFTSLKNLEYDKEIIVNPGPPVYIKVSIVNGTYNFIIIDDYGYINDNNPLEIITINKGNETFLSDNIIKTTPQSLSDTDKNQALTNLGIDPVVWKYLCNPYILENGATIPVELINETNDDYFKYTNRGMYLIHVDSGNIDDKEWNMEGEISMYIPVHFIESDGYKLYGIFTFIDTEGITVTASVQVGILDGKVSITSYQN